ncbi:unnamed protein product [Cutaneotrichosporon oleaginosum]
MTEPSEATPRDPPLPTSFQSLELRFSPSRPLARILSGAPHAHPHTFPGAGTPADPFLVDWAPGERANPYNWPRPYRWAITSVIGISTLCIAFASSAYSTAVRGIVAEFGADHELVVSGLSFYVIGFGLGPLVWAPLSELYGRNIAFYFSYPVFVLFNLVGALSPNIATVLASRLVAGTFGASPITNAGGQISDMFPAHERALATSFFSLAPFLGPVIGPIVGGFVAEYRSWRWVFWVQFFFGLTMCLLSLILVPETYAPTLLRRKARRLQRASEDAGIPAVYIAKYDRIKKSPAQVLRTNLVRPFQLLFRELIAACLAIYGAVIYGTLYLFFEAFPIVFGARGWSLSMVGLSFLGMGVGLLLGNASTPLFDRRYARAAARAAAQGRETPPEARLPGCAVGATALPIGLFVFAWTCTPNVHWIVPIIASVPFGLGFQLIFTGMQLFLIDAYQLYAASALASSAVLRALAGAVFPLFTEKMYTRLGVNWAGTLVAFLSLACAPMPFLFFRYGAYLRRHSKYAPSGPQDGSGSECADKAPQPAEDEALEPEYAPDAGEKAGLDELCPDVIDRQQ